MPPSASPCGGRGRRRSGSRGPSAQRRARPARPQKGRRSPASCSLRASDRCNFWQQSRCRCKVAASAAAGTAAAAEGARPTEAWQDHDGAGPGWRLDAGNIWAAKRDGSCKPLSVGCEGKGGAQAINVELGAVVGCVGQAPGGVGNGIQARLLIHCTPSPGTVSFLSLVARAKTQIRARCEYTLDREGGARWRRGRPTEACMCAGFMIDGESGRQEQAARVGPAVDYRGRAGRRS